ncbi:hypothetical protein BJX64DRAFT_295850 [Aspergillus heterothallicus]
MARLPLRPGPVTEGRDFLFVDHQADVSQSNGVRRLKKSFLARHARRKSRQEAIERLNYLSPLRRSVAEQAKQTQRTAPSEENSLQVQKRRPIVSLTQHGKGLTFLVDRICVVFSTYPLDGARMSTLWSQSAVSLPALLQTLLFLAAAHKSAIEASRGVSAQVVQQSFGDSIYFRVNAIRVLNGLLQDPVMAEGDSTIMVGLNAEFQALDAHIKGLRALIELRGGLDTLSTIDHMTLEKLYYADVVNAALRNTKPSFPMVPEFPPWAPDLPRPPGPPNWDPSMKYTLGVCRWLLTHIELAARIADIVMPTDNDLYLVFQHHLVSLYYPPRATDLNEPIRKTLIIYMYVRVTHQQSFPIMQYMTEALKDGLVPRLPHFKATAPDLLFWILFIGALASHGHSPRLWFVARLGDLASHLGLDEWDDARLVLNEFFYTGPSGVEGSMEEVLWNEMRGFASPSILM